MINIFKFFKQPHQIQHHQHRTITDQLLDKKPYLEVIKIHRHQQQILKYNNTIMAQFRQVVLQLKGSLIHCAMKEIKCKHLNVMCFLKANMEHQFNSTMLVVLLVA